MSTIARTSAVGAASWSADTASVAVADGTVQLVSTDPQRAAVTVMNDVDSAGTLWVVPQPAQSRGGIRVAPGAGVVIASVAPVYGYVTGGSAVVYLLGESGVVC